MEANEILKSDLLDIIFENRNKKYGAYALRKEYDSRIYKALGAIFLLISLFYLLSRLSLNKVNKINSPSIETVLYKMSNPSKPADKKTVTPTKKTAAPKTNTQAFITNLRIVDSTDHASKLSKNLDSTEISSVTQTGITGGKPIIKCTDCAVDSNSHSTTVKIIDTKTPQYAAEVMPSFPGGIDALKKFLERNLTNPTTLNEGEIVSVKVQFVVGYDGKLKGFTVIEDGGGEFNQEVIRVLKKMPDWIPGKTNGQNVSVYYTIPVKFISSE